jgi:hypothetical protein
MDGRPAVGWMHLCACSGMTGNESGFSNNWAKSAYGVRLYAYCLILTHVHLYLETAKANLGRFMHSLTTAYSVYSNLRRQRHGPLVERYKAKAVEGDDYHLALTASTPTSRWSFGVGSFTPPSTGRHREGTGKQMPLTVICRTVPGALASPVPSHCSPWRMRKR